MLNKFPKNALENSKERILEKIKYNKKEITKLLENEPTYMGFVRPYMELNEQLSTFFTPVSHLQSVKNSPESQEAFTSCLGPLTEYSTEQGHDMRVYKAFKAIKQTEYNNLDYAAKKVIDDAIFGFELEGVNLPSAAKDRVKDINIRLSELADQFNQNLLKATNAYKIKITDEKILGLMPESDKAVAKIDDGWEFTLQMPSYIAFMTYVTDRGKREEVYKAYCTRAPENGKVIEEILKLKKEKSAMLSFSNYAVLKNKTMSAPSVAAVLNFLNTLADAGKPFAEKDKEKMLEYARKDGIKNIESYDTGYYSEIVKKAEYDYDEEELRPYFEKNSVISGMFTLLNTLFGLSFEEETCELWDESAKYYNVKKDGTLIGGLYMDLEAREDKRGGAWMNEWGCHHKDEKSELHLPQVFVVANFPKSTPEQASLLRHDDVSTLFHEMGHALHHLMSKVDEAALSGVNGIDWDTVEFPSQFLENFAYTKEVLSIIGKHYKTGAKLPDEFIEKIFKARNFQAGMALLRQLEFGLFDMLIHMDLYNEEGVQLILDNVRRQVSVIMPPQYNKFQNGFSHIFGGGYAAGYYSYKWAEMLSSDAFWAFEEKGVLNKELASKYADTVLALGASKKMDEIYKEFMGREPEPESILKLAGLK